MAAQSEYLINIKVIDGKAQASVDGLTKGFVNLDTALNKVKASTVQASTATDNLGKKNLDMMSKAGLAGATLTEVGRTISDMPYGIRGVANNLSQLSTLFVTLVSTTGGLTNAIKLLKTQLAGPLGVVLAFQAALAALDYFAGSTKKAVDEIDRLGNKFGESATKLMSYQQVLNDSTISEKEKKHVIAEVKKETGDLNVELDANNQLTSESTRLLDKNIDKLLEQAEVRAVLDRLTELNSDKLKLEYKLRQELGSEYSMFINTLNAAGRVVGGGGGLVGALGLDEVENLKGDIGEIDTEIADLLKSLRGKSLDIFKDFKKGGKSRKIIDDFNRWWTKQMDALTVAQSIDLIDQIDNERFQRSNGVNMMIDDRKKKEKKALDAGVITQEEYNSRIIELEYLQTEKLKQINIESDQAIREAKLDNLMGNLEFVAQIGDTFFDAEISREERKTVLMNNQLKERLKNEDLSARQREGINDQIERNEENLQKKRDKLAERQFKIQKAMNIASALSETYRTGILAYGSQLIIGDPSAPIRAQIAQATAIALGLANVAAIARQQFVPSALGGGAGAGSGGAGSGRTIEAPDFNVVGASQTSQLAETVAGQQAKPIKAFVVGKDISTQQELDRNITNTASFG
jgi:hypothetical protein